MFLMEAAEILSQFYINSVVLNLKAISFAYRKSHQMSIRTMYIKAKLNNATEEFNGQFFIFACANLNIYK